MKQQRMGMFKTLRTRLLAVSMLFLIVGILLPVFITSNIFVKQIQTENEKSSMENFSRAAARIHETLRSASLSAFRVQSEERVNRYLLTEHLETDELQQTLSRILFYQAIEEGMNRNDAVNAVLFFRSNNTVCGVSDTWHFYEEYSDVVSPRIVELCREARSEHSNATKWIGAFPNSDFTGVLPDGGLSSSDLYICGVRSLTNSTQAAGREKMTMLVSVTENSLKDCFDFFSDAESSVCLLDETGAQISGADFSLFGKIPDYYGLIDADSQYGSRIFRAADNTEYQLIYYRLGDPDWMLVKTVPTRLQRKSTNTLFALSIGIGLSLLALMAVLYTIWVGRFTGPVNQVTKALLQVKEGNLQVQIAESARTQEVLTMQQQFNEMIRSINELLAQKEKNEQETLLLEMRNLQSQIDPHFIYNSIASIRWMAIFAGADKVSDMLIVLSNLLRPIFSDWTLVWSLDKELSFTDNYIRLIRMRYGDSIRIEIEKDSLAEAAESFQIPRFTLQPLLENSCEHGMRPQQPLKITVSFVWDDRVLTVRVVDNGVGMNPAMMEQLNAYFADPVTEPLPQAKKSAGHSNGIGMININRRLKLQYGDSFGLHLSAPEGGGTCVEVRIRIS